MQVTALLAATEMAIEEEYACLAFLSLSFTLSRALSLSLPPFLSLSLTHTHSPSRSLYVSPSNPPCLPLFLKLVAMQVAALLAATEMAIEEEEYAIPTLPCRDNNLFVSMHSLALEFTASGKILPSQLLLKRRSTLDQPNPK